MKNLNLIQQGFSILCSLALVACHSGLQNSAQSPAVVPAAVEMVAATVTPSVVGAQVTATSALKSIVDASGNSWTLSGGVVLANGKAAGVSAGVVMILYYGGLIYQENGASKFWYWSGSSWISVAADPRVVSYNGALDSVVSHIVDSKLNVWALSGGYPYKNGVKDASNANISNLLYYGNVLYEENTVATWWYYNGSAWVARGALGDPRVTSANEATGSLVVDTRHDVWTIANGEVIENGSVVGSSTAVASLTYFSGAVYSTDSSGMIRTWNGSAWVGANSVEFALPAIVKSAGYTNNRFLDDFNSLSTIDMNKTNVAGKNWYVGGNPTTGLSLKDVNGISVLRMDNSGAAIVSTSHSSDPNKTIFGNSFAVYHGGGAYFEANIAYGQTGAKSAPISKVTKGTTTELTLSTVSVCHPFAPLFCPSLGDNDNHSWIARYSVSGITGTTNMTELNTASGTYWPAPVEVGGVGGVSGAWTVILNVNSSAWNNYSGGGTIYNGAAWPAFWGTSTLHGNGKVQPWVGDPTSGMTHYEEFDFMEYFTGANNSYNSTLIDWWGVWGVSTPCGPITPTVTYSKTYCHATQSQGFAPPAGSKPLASLEAAPNFHKYGALWVPSIKNSAGVYSIGSVQWFFDGQPMGTKFTWQGTPPATAQSPCAGGCKIWANSILDQEGVTIILDTSGGPYMYVDYVAVWQLP